MGLVAKRRTHRWVPLVLVGPAWVKRSTCWWALLQREVHTGGSLPCACTRNNIARTLPSPVVRFHAPSCGLQGWSLKRAQDVRERLMAVIEQLKHLQLSLSLSLSLSLQRLHVPDRPAVCTCPQDRSLKRAQDVRKQLMAIMDRYKLELVSAGRRYDRICKVTLWIKKGRGRL